VGNRQTTFWFRKRPYGYGAGWPLNWKGWTLAAAMLAIVALLPWLLQNFLPFAWLVPATIIAIGVVAIPLTWIANRKTESRRT
jgi:hypothetical protein